MAVELGRNFELDDLGGGHFRRAQHLRAIAFNKPGVGWRRIVSSWADGDLARPHIVSETQLRVRTADNGDRLIMPIAADDDAWFSLSSPFINIGGTWTQPNLGTFSRQGNLLQATTPNVNTYIRHGGHFIKAGFLLKGGWQPPTGEFAFRVDINGLTRSGNQLLYEGQPVMTLSKPIVFDFDNIEDARPIAHEFVQLGGSSYILFTLPNLAGMSRPLIDPTLTLQPNAADGKDTQINPSNSNKSYGTQGTLTFAGGSIIGLIQFDISEIAADATCDDATLSMWNNNTKSGNRSMDLHELLVANDGWVEGTVADPGTGSSTWDNKIEGTTAWAGSVGAATSDTDYDAAILGTLPYQDSDPAGTKISASLTAAAIEDWFGISNANYGLRIKYASGTGSHPDLRTSDNGTAGNRPELVVNYTAAGGGPPAFVGPVGLHRVTKGVMEGVGRGT